jgi:hypothetical protein
VKKAPAIGPGQGDEASTKDRPSPTPLDLEHQDRVDPRLAFLLRAAAKLHLVECCHQDLDTAFADLVPAFREIAVPPCQCEREILDRMDAIHQEIFERRLQEWRWSRPPREKPRPAASTLAAYQYLLQLNDPEKLRAWLERHPEIKP